MPKYFIIILISFIAITTICAQQDSSVTFEDYLEYYTDANSIDEDNSDIIEIIESLMQSPVNLNHATVSDILTIPIIDAQSAQKIIDYRDRHGSFFSPSELYAIEGIDPELIKMIIPLCTVSGIKSEAPNKTLPDLNTTDEKLFDINLRSRIISDIPDRRGFTDSTYNGNKLKSYARLRMSYSNKFSAGILAEKDPGENTYTDFSTFFLSADNILNSKLIAGDFLAQFGQGLILWSPYAFSKGSDAVSTIIRKSRAFTPYSGTDENQFFRGAALTTSIGNFDLSVFYSNNSIDASFNDDGSGVTSTYLAGLHRTVIESRKKDNLKNNSVGVRADYLLNGRFSVSAMHYKVQFNKPFIRKTKYELNGSAFNFSSFAYDFILNKLRFTGEIAYNYISVATISNLAFVISRDISALVSMRSYPRNYTNIYSNGMGEKSGTQNEFGIYTGIKWRSPIGALDLYFDQFKFPHPTSALPLPAKGNELMFNFMRSLPGKIKLNFRYFLERKDAAETIENIEQLVERKIEKYRVELVLSPAKNIRLKSRYEHLIYSIEQVELLEKGYLLFQDARFDLSDNIRLNARLIFFSTKSYNSRLYEFENDLTGVLSNPALYGEGTKWYILLNYNPIDNLKLSLKYSELYKPNEKAIGVGASQISDNLHNYVGIQIEYKM